MIYEKTWTGFSSIAYHNSLTSLLCLFYSFFFPSLLTHTVSFTFGPLTLMITSYTHFFHLYATHIAYFECVSPKTFSISSIIYPMISHYILINHSGKTLKIFFLIWRAWGIFPIFSVQCRNFPGMCTLFHPSLNC
jgi:hypothetical protein